MFRVIAFTEGCSPTRLSEPEIWFGAKANSDELISWLFDRAYGATDSSQVAGQEGEYDEMKAAVHASEEPAVGESIQFGPLPDGYYVKIENLGEVEEAAVEETPA